MSPEDQTPQQPSTVPDPNVQEPTVQPVPTVEMGTPQNQPMTDTYVPQSEPSSNIPPAPKKSKVGLIIGIVAIVLFLLIGSTIAVLVLVRSAVKSGESNTNTSSTAKPSSNAKTNAVTAKYSSDFDVVCEGGSVVNAPAAAKPYKIVSFNTTSPKNDRWSSMSVGYGEPYYVDSDAISTVGVVACLDMVKGSETKAKTCEFQSSGQNVVIDYYAVQYNLTYYEAKTGKALAKGETINGPATTCPFFTSYDKSDPKIYADPDDNAVELVHAKFAQ